MNFLRQPGRNIPSLLLAFFLAVAVWISAVTAADPVEERVYPRGVSIELVGQDANQVLVSDVPDTVTVRLSSPRSVWTRLINEQIPVRAVADLAGLSAGSHTIPIQIQVGIRPVEVVSWSPRSINIVLEPLAIKTLPIRLIQRGELAIGYQASAPTFSATEATVSGPESVVSRVAEVRAILDVTQANSDINRAISLQAVDENELPVNGLAVTPDKITVALAVTQRGGYRNVSVKVVTNGQIATGYRVTSISVFPPAVTVFSPDPRLVDSLPGYIETMPLDLSGTRDDVNQYLTLNLPEGVTLVGNQTVEVLVGVAAIEGSITISNMEVQAINVPSGLYARRSPEQVDVILAGPLPILDRLTARDIQVVVDMAESTPGTYQRVPKVQLSFPELRVESLLPGSIEVIISTTPLPTPTPTRVFLTLTPTP